MVGILALGEDYMKTYLNFLDHFWYYIYKALKSICAVLVLIPVISMFAGISENSDITNLDASVILIFAVLAIFFKLQEDSSKPTTKK